MPAMLDFGTDQVLHGLYFFEFPFKGHNKYSTRCTRLLLTIRPYRFDQHRQHILP